MEALEDTMVKREDGMWLMPELYAVPADKVSHSLLYLKTVMIHLELFTLN